MQETQTNVSRKFRPLFFALFDFADSGNNLYGDIVGTQSIVASRPL